MITRSPMTLEELIEQFNSTYEEWIEVGYPVEFILVSLLHKEREKNYDLQLKIDRLEKLEKLGKL